jgi:RimJ/RimL family protein N-acetyltransferase
MMDIDLSDCYWVGALIRLRAIEPADWETYFAWNHDDEMARRLYAVPFPQSREAVQRWAEHESTRKPEGDNFRFVLEAKAGLVVGDITVHSCERRSGTLAYGISVKKEHRRQGYATEALILVLRYYFEELDYQKVNATVNDFNEPSIRLHEKLGFTREGQLRRMGYTNGRYFDQLIYGMTGEEFAHLQASYRLATQSALTSRGAHATLA